MLMARWVKVASVLLVAGATVSGGGLLSRMAASGIQPSTQRTAQAKEKAKAGPDVPVAEVKHGKFQVTVAGPGNIEVERRSTLLSRVEGRTTILSIVPEGTRVKKGDLVCELDSAALRDQLSNQKITTQGVETSYHMRSWPARTPRSHSRNTRKDAIRSSMPQLRARSGWPNRQSKRPKRNGSGPGDTRSRSRRHPGKERRRNQVFSWLSWVWKTGSTQPSKP
ncbi:MAG: hypothetical protein ACP5XB_14765 [Isosphaeraceae bacterium]